MKAWSEQLDPAKQTGVSRPHMPIIRPIRGFVYLDLTYIRFDSSVTPLASSQRPWISVLKRTPSSVACEESGTLSRWRTAKSARHMSNLTTLEAPVSYNFTFLFVILESNVVLSVSMAEQVLD
jgi:hypothetical protein